jgi:3'(2'), 5'-bisphosphate nucleotidase
LVLGGEPQIGVVGAPAQGLMYVGCPGTWWHAPLARKRSAAGWVDIRVSGYAPAALGNVNVTSHADAQRPLRVAMSRSPPSPELATWLAPRGEIEAHDVGSSLKFCLVAEGAVDVHTGWGRPVSGTPPQATRWWRRPAGEFVSWTERLCATPRLHRC